MRGDVHPQQALAPRTVLLACRANTIVGYIAGHLTRRHGCDGELEWLYVAPTERRQRVASRLIDALAAWFASQNVQRVCVNILPTNLPAKRCYESRGARPLNEHWFVWEQFART
jgi:GNAT superfamily N-acetyltransferase